LGVETWRGDVRNAELTAAACAGCDVVFHVASVAGIWGPWDYFFGINVVGTKHVLEGCLRHGVQRLVYTSSPSVTFEGTDQCHVDESAPYAKNWLCHYPRTKALAERLVRAAHGQRSLATCCLRPHLIWGPGDAHLIPRVIQRARQGRLRRIGDGRNLVDMTYVENAAAAHIQAAEALTPESDVGGKAYFISQGEPVNCWAWIDEILLAACVTPVRKSISAARAWKLGAACEFLYAALRRTSEPPMTRFLAAQLSTSHYFDISAARQDFGYQPSVTKDQGMQRVEDDLRQNRH
jgi:nucleoside-diphosphate-sugar epimerase